MPYVLLYLVVEIVALVALGSWVGVGATLLVLLGGSVLGLLLARREGVRAAQAFSAAVRDRRVAHAELTDGMLVAAAGVLLFVPGLVTDLAGLLLLVPPVRKIVRNRLVRAAERANPGLQRARIYSDGPVVDGDVVNGGPDGGVTYRDGSVRRWATVRTLPRSVEADDATIVEGTVVESDDHPAHGDDDVSRDSRTRGDRAS
ncbi:FxsA family protein [Pseudonocardia sp. N23]|uniref:FxsA family protein n=1 Tax=Pseudonocardia sp. N23 TaxID=1987376 RepID=UPI000BFDAB96|nr:FxsA family protein [Pseudonocardia sp. N23]